LHCQRISLLVEDMNSALPQSLKFLRGYLSSAPLFNVSADNRHGWQWVRDL
jgi:hypothetical protein